MNSRTIIAIVGCWTLPFGGLLAQEQVDPLPPDPPIKKLPEKIQWTRTPAATPASGGESPSGQVPSVVSIETLKAGDIRRTVTTFANGTRMDLWFTDNTFLIKTAGKAGTRLKVFDVDPEFPLVPIPTDLGELNWVRTSKFVKTGEFEQRKAWIFQMTQQPPPSPGATDEDAPPKPVKLQGWVDPESRLPIAFFDGNALWLYKFSAFDGNLALSAELLAELEKFRARAKVDAALRARVP